MINNDENINRFCSYFQENINEIEKLNNRLYQKILIITLIDTLSRVWTNGAEKKNKLRFIKLIKECVNWEHSERISIPMTIYRIENIDHNINKKLKEKFAEVFKLIHTGRISRLNIDPYYSEIEPLIESSEENKLLKNMYHAELLYTYRNNLIHEFREPGYGMEFSNDNTSPYYYGMTDMDRHSETYELVYPLQFFIILANKALTSIKAFLTFNALDPYSFFKFGSPW